MDSGRECSVTDCRKRTDARGLCSSHYARFRRYGDPLGAPERKARPTCAVDGCERTSRSWGYCNMHAQRYYAHGDPLAYHIKKRQPCSIDGCGEPNKGHGLCQTHLVRQRKHGSPHVVLTGGRPIDGELPGSAAIHKRVSRARGRAADYACIDCSGAAEEWSYDNRDPDHLIDGPTNVAYSLSIDHYEPRCVQCHRAFDARHRKVRGLVLMVAPNLTDRSQS